MFSVGLSSYFALNTFSALITKISSFFQRLSAIFAKFNVFHFSPPSLNFSEIFIFSYESNCLKSLLIFQISSPPLFLFTSCKICPCSLYHIIIYVHAVQVFFNCMCKKNATENTVTSFNQYILINLIILISSYKTFFSLNIIYAIISFG